MKVPLPHSATQVACGDNHTVVLLENGQVVTFGKHQEGQLGRSQQEGDDDTWHMTPRVVDSMLDEPRTCRATWVGAKGNQTFIAVDEKLISEHSLSQCKVFNTPQGMGKKEVVVSIDELLSLLSDAITAAQLMQLLQPSFRPCLASTSILVPR